MINVLAVLAIMAALFALAAWFDPRAAKHFGRLLWARGAGLDAAREHYHTVFRAVFHNLPDTRQDSCVVKDSPREERHAS